MISASKYHSYGNSFLILPADQVKDGEEASLAQAICDSSFGIGADGCILLGSEKEPFSIRILNRDGSEAAMSGNGARCACAFLTHRGIVQDRVELLTASGNKVFWLIEEKIPRWSFISDMGPPGFKASEIPVGLEPDSQVTDLELEIESKKVSISALSVGNPQCVVFVQEPLSRALYQELGAALESHPLFPQRTNVSFVRVTAPNKIHIQIWERGVGPTHSSGTGSCGAAVAAIRSGRVESPVEVHTESGFQTVQWESGGDISLTGDSEFVADIRFHWPH